jgi:UDP-N-acetylglucosamine 4,6-dehydratase
MREGPGRSGQAGHGENGGPARVCITGGTGTFGRAMVRTLLARGAERVVVLSRDEVKQGDLATALGHPSALRCLLGDVRDRGRLVQAFWGCEVVIHAAALKRVDQVAYDPAEALATNVLGTQHVCEAAVAAGVRQVVVLSSDKAVAPTTYYGATKMLAESLAVAYNAYSVPRGTAIACTRYGNVAGSRGSVLEVWRRALRTGAPIRLTDPTMTRFWMTLHEAVDLVLRTLRFMRGGEIVVPELPAFRLGDLAAAVAGPEYPVQCVGLRPGGEKWHEELLTAEEVRRTVARVAEVVYVVQPSHRSWSAVPYPSDGIVRPDLVYRSDVTPWRLDVEALRARVAQVPEEATWDGR